MKNRLSPLLLTLSLACASPAAAAASLNGPEPDTPRDPFVDPRAAITGDPVRPDGAEGLLAEELTLMGLSLVGPEPVALVQGGDGLGYVLRAGDALSNSRVVAIDFEAGEVLFEVPSDEPGLRWRPVTLALAP